MDAMDIEMDEAFDVAQDSLAEQIPEAYTTDIITGEEQVRGPQNVWTQAPNANL